MNFLLRMLCKQLLQVGEANSRVIFEESFYIYTESSKTLIGHIQWLWWFTKDVNQRDPGVGTYQV